MRGDTFGCSRLSPRWAWLPAAWARSRARGVGPSLKSPPEWFRLVGFDALQEPLRLMPPQVVVMSLLRSPRVCTTRRRSLWSELASSTYAQRISTYLRNPAPRPRTASLSWRARSAITPCWARIWCRIFPAPCSEQA